MKAAVIYGAKDIRIEEVPYPKLDDDSIIVTTHRASICNASDGEVYTGERSLAKVYPYLSLPIIFGHESSGEVIEVGKNVTECQRGDRIGFWCKPWGAFAEYNKIYPDELAIAKLSDNVSYDEGSVLELVAGTMRGLFKAELTPGLEFGDVVVVIGLGPAGLLFLQEAKFMGAWKVVGIDRLAFRVEKAKELGADLVLEADANDSKIIKRIRDEFNSGKVSEFHHKHGYGGVDMVIDAAGKDVVNAGLQMLRQGGRYFMYGIASKNIQADPQRFVYRSNNIYAPSATIDTVRKAIKQGERLISEGKLKVKPLITHHFPLEKVEEGIRLCVEQPDECIKVVIDIV